MIFAGQVGAILWNLIPWLFGLPSSSSHALFGGLIGAVLIGAGVLNVPPDDDHRGVHRVSGVNFSVVMSKTILPAVVAQVVARPRRFECLAHGLGTVHHPGVLGFRPGLGYRKENGPGAVVHGAEDPLRMCGVLTLPSATLVEGAAADIALTGTVGIIIVFAALLAGAGAIYAISKRAPVSSSNVNDSPDVTINAHQTPVSV
jgi:PiT family inorganic phosphate transporter